MLEALCKRLFEFWCRNGLLNSFYGTDSPSVRGFSTKDRYFEYINSIHEES